MIRPRIVSMWSGPRNVSTAMMYSWRERPDTQVFDEPFYGIYLSATAVRHPSRQAVIDSLPGDPESVCKNLVASPGPPLRFVKNMAHHLDALPIELLDRFENLLLIRNPLDMVPSLAKTLGLKIDVRQTGLPQQLEILKHLQASRSVVRVVDAEQFLDDPKVELERLCDALEIPWQPTMLSWPKGPKPEDGVWAPHWYHKVHASQGFGPYRKQTEPYPEELDRLIRTCIPYYEALREHAL